VGNKAKGKRRLKEAILSTSKKGQATPFRINYGDDLEPVLDSLEKHLSEEMEISSRYQGRWLAVKLMENDEEAQRLVRKYSQKSGALLRSAEEKRDAFTLEHKKSPQKVIAITRHQEAQRIVEASVTRKKEITSTITDRIDQVACNRYLGPVILVATIYLIYELAIVQGYKITEYTWPVLAWSRDLIASLLPSEGFIFDPFFRSMPIWVVDGTIAVLNYVPIFLILFALIAILEDTGYMARMAFILDRIFRYFGLHGQSVLPMVIGGLYVGG
jgi:ferrous iron transport protein B